MWPLVSSCCVCSALNLSGLKWKGAACSVMVTPSLRGSVAKVLFSIPQRKNIHNKQAKSRLKVNCKCCFCSIQSSPSWPHEPCMTVLMAQPMQWSSLIQMEASAVTQQEGRIHNIVIIWGWTSYWVPGERVTDLSIFKGDRQHVSRQSISVHWSILSITTGQDGISHG